MSGTKEIKVQVPEGYEIDKKNSTFECIKLKRKNSVIAMPEKVSGYFINELCMIRTIDNVNFVDGNRNLFTTEGGCECSLALAQPSQIVKHINSKFIADIPHFITLNYYREFWSCTISCIVMF